MDIIGYILIGIGIISLIGNLSGGGGIGDPNPSGVSARFGCYILLIGGGLLLLWL